MAQNLENQSEVLIRRFLQNKKQGALWQSLASIWSSLSDQEKQNIFAFLFHGGHWSFFTQAFLKEAQRSIKSLPWVWMLTILDLGHIELTDAQWAQLWPQLDLPSASAHDKSYESLIKTIYINRRAIHKMQVQEKREHLLASANQAKVESRYEKHLSLLKEFNKIFPKQPTSTENPHRKLDEAERIFSKSQK